MQNCDVSPQNFHFKKPCTHTQYSPVYIIVDKKLGDKSSQHSNADPKAKS